MTIQPASPPKTSSSSPSKRKYTGWKIIGEIFGNVLAILVLTYIVPTLPFVNPDFSRYYPIAVAAAIAGAVIKSVGYLSHRYLQPLFEIAALMVSIYSITQLVLIFPFDFARVDFLMLNGILRFAFIISIIGMAIAILVNLIKIPTSIAKDLFPSAKYT